MLPYFILFLAFQPTITIAMRISGIKYYLTSSIMQHHRTPTRPGSFRVSSSAISTTLIGENSPDFSPLVRPEIGREPKQIPKMHRNTHVFHPAHLRTELRQSKQQDHLDLQRIVRRPFGRSSRRDRLGQLGRVRTHRTQRRELIYTMPAQTTWTTGVGHVPRSLSIHIGWSRDPL